MDYLVLSNNSLCAEYYQNLLNVEYHPDYSYHEILIRARDLVHLGMVLITHPMAGSLKPNQTPFRSIVLGWKTTEDKKPCQDILLMENSIEACEKFLRSRTLPNWPELMLKDFQTLDLSFLQGALSRQYVAF